MEATGGPASPPSPAAGVARPPRWHGPEEPFTARRITWLRCDPLAKGMPAARRDAMSVHGATRWAVRVAVGRDEARSYVRWADEYDWPRRRRQQTDGRGLTDGRTHHEFRAKPYKEGHAAARRVASPRVRESRPLLFALRHASERETFSSRTRWIRPRRKMRTHPVAADDSSTLSWSCLRQREKTRE